MATTIIKCRWCSKKFGIKIPIYIIFYPKNTLEAHLYNILVIQFTRFRVVFFSKAFLSLGLRALYNYNSLF